MQNLINAVALAELTGVADVEYLRIFNLYGNIVIQLQFGKYVNQSLVVESIDSSPEQMLRVVELFSLITFSQYVACWSGESNTGLLFFPVSLTINDPSTSDVLVYPDWGNCIH